MSLIWLHNAFSEKNYVSINHYYGPEMLTGFIARVEEFEGHPRAGDTWTGAFVILHMINCCGQQYRR